MLRANKLPEILEASLLDGIHSAVLMTLDGSIICSKLLDDSPLNETTLAAIGSSVWLNYSPGGTSDVSMIIENLSGGILGIASTQRGYIVALCGNKNTSIGMIRTRLTELSKYFIRVFDQIK